MIVETIQATVFKGGGRRFFTKKAAYHSAARAKIKTRCTCYAGSSYPDGPGETCDYHEDMNRYMEILNRLAYIYKRVDEDATGEKV